jgi:ribonuclease HIII
LQIVDPPDQYIGVDESGKGDYFGPLVIAGVYLGPENIDALENLNILESKRISDKRAVSLADKIKSVTTTSVILIGPEKYNELYAKIKNLNLLLGWGHARIIENVLEKIDCKAAISDQFGDEKLIENSLFEKGKGLKLYQTPKAERFLAVSAASVLARAGFLNYLKKLSGQFKMDFPKGASNLVDQAGRKYCSMYGPDRLNSVAKLHFKNTKKIGFP